MPVLVTDWAPQGPTYKRSVKLPGIDLTAGQFVVAHLLGDAEKKDLPRLGKDESVKEDLFTIAFDWLTSGIDPALIEIARLLTALEKKGIKPPAISYGQSTQQNQAVLVSLGNP